MNKKLLVLIIGALVAIACFRPQVNSFLFKPEGIKEPPVEINTTISEESTIFFTSSEIEWLNTNEYGHLVNLSQDDEKLRVKLFIATQKKEEDNIENYIDSLKLVHPELKDVDLTKLPTFGIPLKQ